jgi:hypothetical protein
MKPHMPQMTIVRGAHERKLYIILQEFLHVKVKLSLVKHCAMKTYRGCGGVAPPFFLTSALNGGEWSASHPCCFTSGEKTPVPIQ